MSTYFNGATASSYPGYYGPGGSVMVAADVTVAGTYFGISLSGLGTVTNSGTISGSSLFGDGIALDAGGALTNLAGGTITGIVAVIVSGGTGQVTNDGTISGQGDHFSGLGIELNSAGTVTNAAGALVYGYDGGIDGTATDTVVNAGTIQSAVHPAEFQSSEGISGVGVVVNEAGGLITGYQGVYAAAGGTVVNAGTIGGSDVGVGSAYFSVKFAGPGGLLVVEGGSALYQSAIGNGGTVEFAAGGGPGTLFDLGSHYTGFTAYLVDANADWTLTGTNTIGSGDELVNQGTLSGGITLASGGLLNDSEALITASGTAVYVEGPTRVVDDGTIEGGSYSVKFAVAGSVLKLNAGAYLVGAAYGAGGTLKLGGADGPGTIAGLGGGTISGDINATLVAFDAYVIGGIGDWTLQGASSTQGHTLTDTGALTNQGTLTGGVTVAAGVLTNDAGATITAAGDAVYVDGPARVVNDGTIDGGVTFSSADGLLKVNRGAVFSGTVDGGGGILKFGGGEGAGTFAGLGSGTLSGDVAGTFTNFGTYVIGNVGDWTLTGVNTIGPGQSLDVNGILLVSGGTLVDDTALGGVGTLGVSNGGTLQLDGNVADTVTITFDGAGLLGIGASDGFAGVIAGLGASDTIDLQGFGYAMTTGLSWDQTASGQGVLTLLNGTQIVTLTLAGSFTSADFYQFEDAAGGTAIIDIAAASAIVGRDPAGAQTRGQIPGAADRGAAGSGPAAPHPGPDWHGVWLHADHA